MVTQGEISYESVTPSSLLSLISLPLCYCVSFMVRLQYLVGPYQFCLSLERSKLSFFPSYQYLCSLCIFIGATFFFFLLFTVFSHFFSFYYTFPLPPLWQLHPVLSPLPNSSPDKFRTASERSPAQHQARCLASCPASPSPARRPCVDGDILFQKGFA